MPLSLGKLHSQIYPSPAARIRQDKRNRKVSRKWHKDRRYEFTVSEGFPLDLVLLGFLRLGLNKAHAF